MTPRASPFRLVLILALVATCAIPPDPAGAQDRSPDLRSLRAELVALDDSIERTERHLAELTLATACMQALPPLAPVAHLRRCLGESPRPVEMAQPAATRTVLFAGALASGVLANALFAVNTDRGGYVDSWRTPDKAAHAAIAANLVFLGAELDVPRWTAAALVCGAGYGFEVSQGWVSSRDVLANCAGAGTAALLSHLAERW